MKKPLANSYNRLVTPEEQRLYDHWTKQVSLKGADELVEQFQLLFIVGSGYSDRQIAQALEKILNSKLAEEDFIFILNRCCYILLDGWHSAPNRREAVEQLIQLFEAVNTHSISLHLNSRRQKQLLEFVQAFTRSDQYLALKRFAEVLCQSPGYYGHQSQSQPLRKLIRRYPYLYQHCLLNEDSSYEHCQMIQQIQAHDQRKFELDLSRYAAHQWRRAEVARVSMEAAKNIKSPLDNPTLLTNRELVLALRQFAGKVEGNCTYRDVAKRFVTHTSSAQTFQAFKDDLYDYLLPSSFSSAYARRQFGNRLYKQLHNTIPYSNDEPYSEFLLLRTCSQILNFLVIESPQKPSHSVFIDLIGNTSPTFTVSLLLKLVLICRRARPYLEKRFSILFSHYESSSQDGVLWLVKVLENLNIALTVNFGKADLSFVN
ncbi:MAG: hypothetical protein ACRC8A_05670 [Microcoleaceae cyanobacterium]